MAGAETEKVYLHKATQTESPLALLTGSVINSNAADDILDLTMELSLVHDKPAYINPGAQEPDFVTRNIPLRPSIPRRQRYAQLHCNRPSNFGTSAKRVVSFPENYAGSVDPEAPPQRVVSMPERLQPLSSDTSGSFSSAEISSISLGSQPGSTSPLRCRNHEYSSDLPSTPSPPSSPESIMIIGHNSQVPRTLLRSNYAYSQTYGDNGGWISWANSPPRPIPALHGPLSLPYARCPSGAEGTIIEGEDLTNMIWGLNADETQSRSHGSTNVGQKVQNVPPRMQKSPKLNACPLPSVGTIDLSQLTIPRYPDEASVGRSSVVKQPETTAHGRPQYHPVRLPESEGIQSSDWRKGLGLSWQDPIELPPPKSTLLYQGRGYNTLKASAPPFVPSSASASRSAPHLVVEPYISGLVRNVAWPSCQDHAKESMSYLPTPPSSSSPLWSPYVSTPTTMVLTSPQVAIDDLPEDKQLLLSQLFSPSIPTKNHMQDFDCWFVERVESGAKLNLASLDGASTFPVSKASLSANVLSSDDPIKRENFSATQNLRNAHANNTSDLPVYDGLLHQTNHKTISASPERHFRGISHQPRSIPLARLIQRRLSSVAEEDINVAMEEDNTSPNPRLLGSTCSSQSMQAQPESVSSVHQAVKRTSSPGTDNIESRTCQEFIHTTAPVPNQANMKVIVKLPSTNTSSIQDIKGVHTEENENSKNGPAVSLTGAMPKRKIRNRRSRSSSAQGSK